MNKIYKNILLTALTLATGAALTGCGDFLDPKSKSEFVPKDAQSLNELLLGEAYPISSMANFECFVHLLDDDVTAAPYQEPSMSVIPDLYFSPYTWQGDLWETMRVSGSGNVNIYAALYQKILGCNAILDYIDQAIDSKTNKDYVLGQAYALRAFYYLQLVNVFAKPYALAPESEGVPLKVNSGIENKPLSRATVAQVYDQMIADLHQAEAIFLEQPKEKQWKANFRVNLPMIQMLLSRTYLYMEKWTEAAEYAKKVMDNTNFSLLNLANIPTVNEENGLPYYYDYHDFKNSSEVIWGYGDVDDFTKYVADRRRENGRNIWPTFRASDELLASFDETPGDLRKERYIVTTDYCSEYYVTDEEGNQVKARMPLVYGKISVSPTLWNPKQNQGDNGRSIRLSEAYLNYAEACANLFKEGHGDGRTNALSALNELRKYRFDSENYQALDIAGADQLVEFVHNERRRELCYEGHRWFDIRRWGTKEIRHIWYTSANSYDVYVLHPNDPGFVVPLPDTALESNPELHQNELSPIPRSAEETVQP